MNLFDKIRLKLVWWKTRVELHVFILMMRVTDYLLEASGGRPVDLPPTRQTIDHKRTALDLRYMNAYLRTIKDSS